MLVPGTHRLGDGGAEGDVVKIDEMGAYLFPDDNIVRLDDQALLDFIECKLGDALDMTDGSDFGSDLRIDIAQDRIEQARDILLSRGYVFSPDQQERISFLQWPLSLEPAHL